MIILPWRTILWEDFPVFYSVNKKTKKESTKYINVLLYILSNLLVTNFVNREKFAHIDLSCA